MFIDILQKAKEHFNSEAEKMLLLLSPASTKSEVPRIKTSESHKPSITITEKDIINFGFSSLINGFGHETAKYFQTSNGPIGFEEEDFEKFEKFVSRLSKKENIRRIISENFIKFTMFEWFESRYKGTVSQTKTFIDFIESKTKATVVERKVLIPISFMAIEAPFNIGNVRFNFFSKEMLDNWEEIDKKKMNDVKPKQFFDKLRKDYQGVVFSSYRAVAEKIRAIEMAKEETEKALMILRFFSPTVFLPQIPSYFGMKGKVNIPYTYVFLANGELLSFSEGVDEKRQFIHTISVAYIKKFKKIGLSEASVLISKTSPTEFERLLLNGLYFFSRGITANEFQDKLVYMLVAAETVLLQNTSEPIQWSLGQRIAFLSASAVDKRKNVIKTVKDAYKLRSAYIHHGRSKEDYELLQRLQRIIWTAFRNLLQTTREFSTQSDLIEFIEAKILS